jgi:hypothetical protein
MITWECSPRLNSTQEWAQIIEDVDHGVDDSVKPTRKYQKKCILNTSSTLHTDGHAGNYVRVKPVVAIEMDKETLALWEKFQEEVGATQEVEMTGSDLDLESDETQDDESGVGSIFVGTKVLKPWNELTQKRKTQFGRDFKKPFEDFLIANMPNYSLGEAISVVDELFSISKTKSDVAAKLSTALQAAYKREDSQTIAQLGSIFVEAKVQRAGMEKLVGLDISKYFYTRMRYHHDTYGAGARAPEEQIYERAGGGGLEKGRNHWSLCRLTCRKWRSNCNRCGSAVQQRWMMSTTWRSMAMTLTV